MQQTVTMHLITMLTYNQSVRYYIHQHTSWLFLSPHAVGDKDSHNVCLMCNIEWLFYWDRRYVINLSITLSH